MSEISERDLALILKNLDTVVWQRRVGERTIEDWLSGFGEQGERGSVGRRQLLYLLSRFMYFGDYEIRALLKTLYRDHYRYPIIAAARRQAAHTRDILALTQAFQEELHRTKFVGIGNVSESGPHLLYMYRQENQLSVDQFTSIDRILESKGGTDQFVDRSITRYVIIDDFCGSGQQAIDYASDVVSRMRKVAQAAGAAVNIEYHLMFALHRGIKALEQAQIFDKIECVLRLDKSYRVFGNSSRYFSSPPSGIDFRMCEKIAYDAGRKLLPNAPLGYDNSQLMLGFQHNIPDNTLPIFWHPGVDKVSWCPVFPRHLKS